MSNVKVFFSWLRLLEQKSIPQKEDPQLGGHLNETGAQSLVVQLVAYRRAKATLEGRQSAVVRVPNFDPG